MTTRLQFNALSGQFDLVTATLTPSEIVGGNPNQFAYFNTAGTLDSLPNWAVDVSSTPNRFGLRYGVSYDNASATGYNANNAMSANINPSADAPSDTEVMLQLNAQLDSSNSGFGFGTAGTAYRGLDVITSVPSSAAFGEIQGTNVNLNVGDSVITGGSSTYLTAYSAYIHALQGFDAGFVRGLSIGSDFDAGSNISSGLTLVQANTNINGALSGAFAGFEVYASINASNTVTNGASGVHTNLSLGGDISYANGISDTPNMLSGLTITGQYSSFNSSPVIQAGSAVRSMTLMNISPQFSAPITDDIRGTGVFFTSPQAGANIVGNDISINNAASTGGQVIGLNININNSTDANPQGVVGISSNARMNVNATTEMVSAQGFQIGNRIESLLHIPSGSPVTGTDSLGNNLAGDLIAEDNLANGSFGIGWNGTGFISSVGVAAGKTVESATIFLPAISFPDPGFATGGHIEDLHIIRSFAPLPQGGTATVDRLYGLKLDPLFGNYSAVATDSWGIYVGDTDADNYFAKNVVIGGVTGQPTGAFALDVIGDAAIDGSLNLKGSTSGVLTIEAAPTTTSHTLVMPAAQGAAGTVLENDGSGNLSWAVPSTPTATSFSIANNQSSPAAVPGFNVNPTFSGFSALFNITRMHTGDANGEVNEAIMDNIIPTALDSFVTDVAFQSDGKIIIVGGFTNFDGNGVAGVVRLNADGTEDTSFSTAVGTGVSSNKLFVELLSDGSIIIAGDFSSFNGNSTAGIVKLQPSGVEDATFMTNVGVGIENGGNPAFAAALAVDSADNIFVGGRLTTVGGVSSGGLAKLDSDGVLSTAFATAIGTGFPPSGPSHLLALAILSDDSVVVGGQFTSFNSNTRNRLVKLDNSGSEDTAFYTALGTAFGGNVNALAVTSSDDIIVGGNFLGFNSNSRNRIVKVDAAGTEDTTFYTNTGGGVGAGQVYALCVQPVGKIVVAGDLTDFGGQPRDFIVRLESTGVEDTVFYSELGTGFNNEIYALAAHNNILAVGGMFSQLNSSTREYFVALGGNDVEVLSTLSIKGAKHPTSGAWIVGGETGVGSDPGMTFTMDTAGDLFYQSSNLLGTPTTSVGKYLITGVL